MRFTAIDTSAWEELKKSIEELALCMPRTLRNEARTPRPVTQRGRVPNTEHQQANAPALSGYVRAALYPNRTQVLLQT